MARIPWMLGEGSISKKEVWNLVIFQTRIPNTNIASCFFQAFKQGAVWFGSEFCTLSLFLTSIFSFLLDLKKCFWSVTPKYIYWRLHPKRLKGEDLLVHVHWQQHMPNTLMDSTSWAFCPYTLKYMLRYI